MSEPHFIGYVRFLVPPKDERWRVAGAHAEPSARPDVPETIEVERWSDGAYRMRVRLLGQEFTVTIAGELAHKHPDHVSELFWTAYSRAVSRYIDGGAALKEQTR